MNFESMENHSQTWVQCDNPQCRKWRLLNVPLSEFEMDELWFCSNNQDLTANNCEKPVGKVHHKQKGYVYIYSEEFTLGSLVWAKLGKYPSWPAVVIMSLEENCFTFGDYIHVEFLGKNSSRAWVKQDNTSLYNVESNAIPKMSLSLREDFKFAQNKANVWLKWSKETRLEHCVLDKIDNLRRIIEGEKHGKHKDNITKPTKNKKKIRKVVSGNASSESNNFFKSKAPAIKKPLFTFFGSSSGINLKSHLTRHQKKQNVEDPFQFTDSDEDGEKTMKPFDISSIIKSLDEDNNDSSMGKEVCTLNKEKELDALTLELQLLELERDLIIPADESAPDSTLSESNYIEALKAIELDFHKFSVQ